MAMEADMKRDNRETVIGAEEESYRKKTNSSIHRTKDDIVPSLSIQYNTYIQYIYCICV